MNKTFKQIALIMLIALIVLVIFKMNQSDGEKKYVTYTKFIQKVQNKEVDWILI